MQEILYLEVPTPATATVQAWLQTQFKPQRGQILATTSGIRWQLPGINPELSVFVWSLQRTTYLKVFRWGQTTIDQEQSLIDSLKRQLLMAFPLQYHEPPQIDLSRDSIFTALEPEYPLTVKYFQQMPNGEADLQRVYWWEQRWREGVRHPQAPKQIITKSSEPTQTPDYDLIYIGGALGVVHAAVMARLGYRVLLLERLPFGRMNREWNISRAEFQHLIDLGLFTAAEFESIIAREYWDGFNKFFSATTPKHCQAPILHTPTVLNIAVDSSQLLELCGQKLRQAGGEIWDETEFLSGTIHPNGIKIQAQHRPTHTAKTATGRLLVDAMGTASPIAWQLNGGAGL